MSISVLTILITDVDCLATSERQHNSKKPSQKKKIICYSTYNDRLCERIHTLRVNEV